MGKPRLDEILIKHGRPRHRPG